MLGKSILKRTGRKSLSRVYAALRQLVRSGRVVRDSRGYRLAE
jgi:hypothetical protein